MFCINGMKNGKSENTNMIKKLLAKNVLVSKSFRNTAFLSVLFNALGKGVYFLSILLIGRVLGANEETDVYFFTISLITVFVGFSNLINSDVLIPRLIFLRTSEELKIKEVLGFFYTLYIAMGLIVTVVVLLFPQFFLDLFSKFKAEVIINDYRIFSFLFPILLLNILIGLQSSILIAYNYFITPSLITFLTNCLGLGVFFIFRNSLGIYAAVIGLIISSLIANIFLSYYLIKLCKIKVKPTFKIDFSIFKSIEYVTGVYIAFSIYSLGLIYLLTTTDASTLTAYNNAQLIAFMPFQFIAVQLAMVMSNKFAEFYNTSQFDKLKKYIKLTLWVITLIILPLCFVTIVFSGLITDIVSINNKSALYKDRFSIMLVYLSLPAYFNAIYFCAIRLYTTTLRVKLTSIVQSVMCLSLLLADYIGLKYFHIQGFCIANIVMYSMMFIVSLIMIRNFYKIIDKKQAELAAKSIEEAVVVSV